MIHSHRCLEVRGAVALTFPPTMAGCVGVTYPSFCDRGVPRSGVAPGPNVELCGCQLAPAAFELSADGSRTPTAVPAAACDAENVSESTASPAGLRRITVSAT